MTARTILKGILALGLTAGLGACSEDAPGNANGAGHLNPLVGLDTTVKAPRQDDGSRAGTDISAADLSLKLVSDDGSLNKEWPKVSDFDVNQEFKVGNYTLTAWYGSEGAQGFECPYYTGSTRVTVQDGVTTEVALSAKLGQAMISVEYTEAFKSYMTDWSAKVGDIAFVKDEARAAYVTPGSHQVTVSFTKPNGKTGDNILVATIDAKAQTHYHVKVDFNEGHVGSAEFIVITYDDEMAENVVDVDISDKVLDAAAPEISAEGFTSGDIFTSVVGMPFAQDLKINIIAPAGIAKAVLTTKSASLLEQGWPESADLAEASSQAALAALGLNARGLFGNVDKLAVVDFTNVPANIKLDPEGRNTSEFSLTVTDRYGKTTEAVSFSLTVEPLVMNLVALDPYTEGQPVKVTLEYNGVDPQDKISFSYLNRRGTWTPVTDVTIAEASRAAANYTVTLGGITDPKVSTEVQLKAECGSTVSELTVKGFPFEIAVSDNDVFARHAFMAVSNADGDAATLTAGARYMVSTDGSNFTEAACETSATELILTGLTDNTDYTFYAEYDGIKSKRFTFHTETALGIPNGNLDADVTIAASKSNWQNVVFEGWGTNNAMTTSEGGNFEYTRISGTISVDGQSGKAALIRTVGWGEGNSAVGTVEGAAIMHYADAGLLHLGATRTARPAGYTGRSGSLDTDDLECGIAFASRPSSISFSYKYSAKNSADHGEALAWVMDADGNILSTARTELSAKDAYETVTLPFTYSRGAAKAAKVYVRFLSTNVPDALTKSNAWFTAPKFMIGGPYMGSQLTIDNVEPNY